MNYFITFLFVIASIGVINGLIASIILLLKPKLKHSDRLLGGLLLALVIRIGKSIFYYFDHDTDRLILQIGLSACLFIGPFFFKYIQTSLDPKRNWQRIDTIGFSSLLIAIIVIGSIFPYRSYPMIWNGYIIHFIYLIWMLIVILALLHARTYIARLLNMQNWKLIFQDHLFICIVSTTLITLTFQAALYINGLTYIWGALLFTGFFYYSLVYIILTARHKKITTHVLNQSIENSYEMLRSIQDSVRSNKYFLNPKLKLDDLAHTLHLDRNTLSRILNEAYPHGFNQFINDFRIEEAKELMLQKSAYSLEGIGYEAGFNSKSSFYNAFKRSTGCTPAQYRKQNLTSPNTK